MGDILQQISGNAHNVVPFMVLLLPLLGFVVLCFFGDGIQREGHARAGGVLACTTVVTSFLLSLWTVRHLFTLNASETGLRFMQPYLGFDWIEVGSLRLPFSLLVDPLSAVMILTVTGVGSLIHIYSLGYMSHDDESVRYFSYLNLFTFFMLVLVLGGSLPLLFIGWEGVGLCSYLLIGFWYRKQSASDAGKKAFVVNRIGDAGLILGMILAFYTLGTLDLVDLATNAAGMKAEDLGQFGPYTVICLLLFVGACGKSAQVPLHVWLPDAMEGPTPVSALIHAATMVTAGVYMVARLGSLYSLSPTSMMVVAVIGAATALMGATIALVQTDIKKVLAYSTVSQLGYMFLACGVGAFGVAVFHLFTHAFFKALLFLGSGSVIHALSGEQDMRRMGGLRTRIPWTFWTFLIGTAAIAGIPFLAGFYSKDAILLAAFEHHRYLLFGIALFTALLTAFYMSRLLFLTFFGEYRGDLEKVGAAQGHDHAHAAPVAVSGDAPGHEPPAAHGAMAVGTPAMQSHDAPAQDAHAVAGHAPAHAAAGHDAAHAAASHDAAHGAGHGHGGHTGIHESPWSMLVPLIVLAIGSAVVGQIDVPHIVEPVLRLSGAAKHAEHPIWLPVVATLVAILGIAGAYNVYILFPELPARFARTFRGLARIFEAKWGFDIAYDWFARRVVVEGSDTVLWRTMDAEVIDGAVNGAGVGMTGIARATRNAQSGLVRGYALVILGGAVVLLTYLLWMR